ncbi:hypothetical protein [Nostoc sp.]|uniref:hypothetical protein n=1 Tax=Nostoc sp. TaxID=1180 RepID=UPI002FF62B1C
MTTKLRFKTRVVHSKVAKAVEFGKTLLANSKSDFILFSEFEKLLYSLLDKELYSEYVERMADVMEVNEEWESFCLWSRGRRY